MLVKIIEKVYKYCYYSIFLAKYEFCFKPPIREYYNMKKHHNHSTPLVHNNYDLNYAIKRNMIGDYHILNNILNITEITDSLIEVKSTDQVDKRSPFFPRVIIDNKRYTAQYLYYYFNIHKKRLYYSLNDNVNLKLLKRGEKVDIAILKQRIWHSLFGIHIYTDIKVKDYIDCVKYSLESIGYKNVKSKLVNSSNEFDSEFIRRNTNSTNRFIRNRSSSRIEYKYKYIAEKIVVDY